MKRNNVFQKTAKGGLLQVGRLLVRKPNGVAHKPDWKGSNDVIIRLTGGEG